ncbi:hypothetical protein [Kribbella deserti]|uniref:Uncharacterized protein n=1 Tax=Kribbella deserti TaxID=1926257 RepID=A0ABV6QEZ8_9ACTN
MVAGNRYSLCEDSEETATMNEFGKRMTAAFTMLAAAVLLGNGLPAGAAASETGETAVAGAGGVQVKTVQASVAEAASQRGVTRLSTAKAAKMPAKIQGFPTPNARSYYITASCNQWASQIRQGATAWNNLTEGGGTPVSCVPDYITDCGSGTVIGCNYGAGRRITLAAARVGDVALLAAHEFGHDWFGHSGTGCADWSSAAAIMRTSICG